MERWISFDRWKTKEGDHVVTVIWSRFEKGVCHIEKEACIPEELLKFIMGGGSKEYAYRVPEGSIFEPHKAKEKALEEPGIFTQLGNGDLVYTADLGAGDQQRSGTENRLPGKPCTACDTGEIASAHGRPGLGDCGRPDGPGEATGEGQEH